MEDFKLFEHDLKEEMSTEESLNNKNNNNLINQTQNFN
jgi:hypothetical protein